MLDDRRRTPARRAARRGVSLRRKPASSTRRGRSAQTHAEDSWLDPRRGRPHRMALRSRRTPKANIAIADSEMGRSDVDPQIAAVELAPVPEAHPPRHRRRHRGLQVARPHPARCASAAPAVRCILTKAAQQFVTPLSAAAWPGDKVYTDLFIADGRGRDGPYRARRATPTLVVVAPATADLMAKMAQRARRRPRLDRAARHRQAGARSRRR